MIAGLVIGAVALLAMIGISWYGWTTLPADARVPVHWGPTAYNNFVSKRVGLVIHPAAGALVYVLFAVAQLVQDHHGRPPATLTVLLPLVMCLLLVVQLGAIRIARSRAGLGSAG
jgi:hypothetical protein